MSECERCKDWSKQGLSDTCPACDMIAESKPASEVEIYRADAGPLEFVDYNQAPSIPNKDNCTHPIEQCGPECTIPNSGIQMPSLGSQHTQKEDGYTGMKDEPRDYVIGVLHNLAENERVLNENTRKYVRQGADALAKLEAAERRNSDLTEALRSAQYRIDRLTNGFVTDIQERNKAMETYHEIRIVLERK